MKRWKKIAIGVAAVLGVVVIVLALGPGRTAIAIGTGYAAKRVCSESFVAGRDAKEIVAVDLAFLPIPIDADVDSDAKRVTVGLVGVEQRAVYREGLGCTLVHDVDEEKVRAQAFTPKTSPTPDAEWPIGEKLPETLPQGVDKKKIEAALDYAFSEPEPDNLRRTRAALIVYKGKLVGERYARGFSKETPILGWSMTKSVTSALAGVLVERGELKIADKAPIAGWSGDDPRAAITVDQLIRMSTGLRFDESYTPLGDATAMLYRSDDMAAFAAGFPLAAEPDGAWSYSSGTTNLLSRTIRNTINDDARYHRFPKEGLLDRIGARSATMEADASGTFVGSSYLYMTGRDWARFGLLFAQDGMWEKERILPEGWVKYSCAPTKHAPHGSYGGQWWLNAGDGPDDKERAYPKLPTDMCYASGFETQRVMIFPSHDLVVVRLGLTVKRDAFDVEGFVLKVFEAVGKG